MWNGIAKMGVGRPSYIPILCFSFLFYPYFLPVFPMFKFLHVFSSLSLYIAHLMACKQHNCRLRIFNAKSYQVWLDSISLGLQGRNTCSELLALIKMHVHVLQAHRIEKNSTIDNKNIPARRRSVCTQ